MAHHNPNWEASKLTKCPTNGKTNKAIEFRIKIVPNATEICFSSALMAGAMAAIALPPQIAVPPEIKKDVFFSIFKSLETK